MFDHIQFTLIHRPNISGSYAIPFFTASDFTPTTRHTHTWALKLLRPSRFALTGATSECPLLFPSSILDTSQPGGLLFRCCVFLPFHTVHGILQARMLEWAAISFSSGPRFVRTLHHDPSTLGGPAWHSSYLHCVMQAPSPQQGSDTWRGKI